MVRIKNKLVHRLIAEFYIDNPNKYKIVNHIDEDITNNNISNLEWCTQKHNVNHSKNNGKWLNHIVKDKGKRGVSKDRYSYKTSISINDVVYHIGSYKNKDDAYNAYHKVFTEWYGFEPWEVDL